MQKITQSELSLRPLDGVLLTREHLLQRKRALNIYEEAKERARKILSAAEKEADKIRDNAQAEGREEGLLALLDIFSEFVTTVNDSSQALITSCMNTLRNNIEELFNDDLIINHLIAQWWQEQIKESVSTTTVRLHHSYKKLEHPVKAFLEEKGCDVQVQIDDEPGCHIKAGDYVLELSTDVFAQRLALDIINSQDDFIERMRYLSEETCEKIKIRLTTEAKECL